jgi:DnaJ-class molecular chaperone
MSYYEILKVSKDASQEDIKKAWKKLSMLYHPDRLPEEQKQAGESKFKEITKAYEVLQDSEKRKLYDLHGEEGLNSNNFNNSNIFSQLFNQNNNNSQALPPIVIHINLTLEEIYTGTTINKKISRNTLCKTCNYTGFEDKIKRQCDTCNGTGVATILRQLGPGMIQQMRGPCTKCSSTGKSNNTNFKKCLKCTGEAYIKEDYIVKCDIGKSVKHNEKIILENLGNEHILNKKNIRSNVILVVNQEKHDTFTRDKNDLHITLSITLLESLCGFYKVITLLDKTTIYFTTESNVVKHNSVVKISNLGINIKGDLYIKYNVVYQEEITQEMQLNLIKIFDKDNSYKRELSDITNMQVVYTKITEDIKEDIKEDTREDQEDDHDNNDQEEQHVGAQQCAQQ